MRAACILPLIVGLAASTASCGGGERTEVPAPAASPQPEAAADAPAGSTPLAKSTVTLYFPSANGDGLVAEPREIVDTARPTDRGTQIVAALLDGPQVEGSLPALPAGTTLRQLWVRDDGNAFVDFSDELASGMTGGSTDEILTIYAVIDSLTTNVPSIRRVGILIGGRERETLGHLDLRRPLPADLTLVAKSSE